MDEHDHPARAGGRLAGKTVLITGTGGGQGRASALLFAREGARIVGCDVKEDGARETEAMVRAQGGEMVSLAPLDLSKESAVREWIAFAVDAYGDFDVLYNNASAVRTGSMEAFELEDLDFCVANELALVLLAVKHALPVFKRRGGGVIVNTASVAGILSTGLPGNTAGTMLHNICKAGVIRLSEHLAVELSPHAVRVNCISPGLIDSPATRPLFAGGPEATYPRAALDALLIRRLGQPEDVAALALFLASDESSYITGANIVVDGGWTAGGGVGRPSADLTRHLEETIPELLSGGRAWRQALGTQLD